MRCQISSTTFRIFACHWFDLAAEKLSSNENRDHSGFRGITGARLIQAYAAGHCFVVAGLSVRLLPKLGYDRAVDALDFSLFGPSGRSSTLYLHHFCVQTIGNSSRSLHYPGLHNKGFQGINLCCLPSRYVLENRQIAAIVHHRIVGGAGRPALNLYAPMLIDQNPVTGLFSPIGEIACLALLTMSACVRF